MERLPFQRIPLKRAVTTEAADFVVVAVVTGGGDGERERERERKRERVLSHNCEVNDSR